MPAVNPSAERAAPGRKGWSADRPGLVAFVHTVDAGSFSAASRPIGSTQSAVSKSVACLERRLGVRLIQRSTRTLSVTTEGQAYYAWRHCFALLRKRKTSKYCARLLGATERDRAKRERFSWEGFTCELLTDLYVLIYRLKSAFP